MVAILRPAGAISTDRLQMSVWVFGEHDVLIGRRNREACQPAQQVSVPDSRLIGTHIDETAACALPANRQTFRLGPLQTKYSHEY
jgi:hypothetical protein